MTIVLKRPTSQGLVEWSNMMNTYMPKSGDLPAKKVLAFGTLMPLPLAE